MAGGTDDPRARPYPVSNMQFLKSGFRSGKLATCAGLLLIVFYIIPEFFGGVRDVPISSPLSDGAQLGETVDLASLDEVFAALDYHLEDVRNGQPVPRLYVDQVPVDIDSVPDVDKRKDTFIKLVLPLILSVNERIAAQRERLTALLDAKVTGRTLAAADRHWLDNLAARYRTDPDDPFALLDRVDAVPVSLALAQAIEESGWGASRFAREGNALFGQRIWTGEQGLVPEKRAEDATYMVRRFDSIADSISAYIHNLNTHPAYEEFRRARAELQDHSASGPDSLGLVATLRGYSEKGMEYVNNLRLLISSNRLQDFEAAELAR